ncbi:MULTISPECIES: flagellar hook-basal body complex protein FliE [Tatumella]|mgnify:FL=1|uniref:Flagellar hook-basal body complex protein FliE n=2 Tax=Tatumella ptyseos TaxID=82987 RepID=A0A085JKI6_9GAMM|nr:MULTISPECIES: flagellar hook-basal body complex protein FliE [Tatumella]KFD20982.1 FliE family flagellar hook-basal body complex protein [Tatumella ptyseos ATCC 33301]SQK76999.1 flagellar hook-basal body protein FliE [Tatumella ptyseos]
MVLDPLVSLSTAVPASSLSDVSPVISADEGAFLPALSQESSFQSVLSQSVSQVNQLQLDAASRQQALNAGQSDDLAGAMVASQKANISFSALLQVRNKLTSALDDLLNTPL